MVRNPTMSSKRQSRGYRPWQRNTAKQERLAIQRRKAPSPRNRACTNPTSSAAKEEEQLNDQDQHHDELQNEGAGLVKLFDHEIVQLVRRVDFFLYEFLVVIHADFDSRHFVQAGGEHVANKL